MNPYHQFVDEFARSIRTGSRCPLGNVPATSHPIVPDNAPGVLLFSPHPDDECIISGLPLRLRRECGMRVANVAVTQGSNPDRQDARLKELREACDFIGYELIQTAERGLEQINAVTRDKDPNHWRAAVDVISELLSRRRPRIIFFPHECDWNVTHIGTHLLVRDALQRQESGFECFVVETEYWGAMATPNLMVESTLNEVSDMVTGVSFHRGEVQRNPFHIGMPSWLHDNVRRGAELVFGQGGQAYDFLFATLYRLSRWRQGRHERWFSEGRALPSGKTPEELFC